MKIQALMPADWPVWLPDEARLYLAHVRSGQSIRDLARAEGVHASTILRRIRAFELRRDDPLVRFAGADFLFRRGESSPRVVRLEGQRNGSRTVLFCGQQRGFAAFPDSSAEGGKFRIG